jgi:hypothetical protein
MGALERGGFEGGGGGGGGFGSIGVDFDCMLDGNDELFVVFFDAWSNDEVDLI